MKTKTVITAPVEEQQNPSPSLAEYEAIEHRLASALATVKTQAAEHRAQLAAIAEALAELPGPLQRAQERLATLQQEQAMLPRRTNAARAFLVGASSTSAEAEAQKRLDTLQARAQTLPPDLAEAEAQERSTRAELGEEQARLESERASHQEALAELAGLAEALREEAQKARWQIGQAYLERLKVARQEKAAALEAAEGKVREAKEALAAFDAAIPDEMGAHPTHLGEAIALLPQPENKAVVLFQAMIDLIKMIESLYYNPALGQQAKVPAFIGGTPIGKWLELEAHPIHATISGQNDGGRLAERRTALERMLSNIRDGSIFRR